MKQLFFTKSLTKTELAFIQGGNFNNSTLNTSQTSIVDPDDGDCYCDRDFCNICDGRTAVKVNKPWH